MLGRLRGGGDSFADLLGRLDNDSALGLRGRLDMIAIPGAATLQLWALRGAVMILGGLVILLYGFHLGRVTCENAHAGAALKQQQKEIKQIGTAAADLGQKKEHADVVYRTITEKVDRYIDRPVYRSTCLDADGLRDANAALAGPHATGPKPDPAVPGSHTPGGWHWFQRATQIDRRGETILRMSGPPSGSG